MRLPATTAVIPISIKSAPRGPVGIGGPVRASVPAGAADEVPVVEEATGVVVREGGAGVPGTGVVGSGTRPSKGSTPATGVPSKRSSMIWSTSPTCEVPTGAGASGVGPFWAADWEPFGAGGAGTPGTAGTAAGTATVGAPAGTSFGTAAPV